MPVSGPLLRQAHNAILDSYDRNGLRQALTFCFGLSLDALVAEGPFADQLLDLLSRAERTGNLLGLLHCLADGRPGNREALDLAFAAVHAVYAGSPPQPDPTWGVAGALDPAQLAAYERRYLAQLRRECRYIRTEGVGESAVELVDVFVMLQATEAPRPPRGAAAGRPDVTPTFQRREEMGLADPADETQARASERNQPPPSPPPPPVPLAQALREHAHLAVLGEPGSGKSTALQFLALCFASAGAPQARLALDEARVPIWLELRTWTGDRPFAAWLAQGIAGYGLFHPADSAENERIARLLLDHWLGEGRAILLLDALDEALELGRGPLLREIDRFAGTAAGEACRIVLTSRIAEYGAEQRPGSGFEQYVIHPFRSEADALPYAAGWLGALAKEPLEAEAAQQAAQRLLAQMAQQGGLRRIFTNPLLLRLAITVQLTTGEPLHNRAEIYRRYVDEVLWGRSQRRNAGGFTLGQVQQALACVAWTLHAAPQTPAPVLAEKISAAQGPQVDGHAMLLFLQHGLGLLGTYDYARGTLLAFRHLTFQEFLVGRRLAKLWAADREAAWRLLRPRLHHPAWREPLLLMAGLLDPPAAVALARQVLAARSPYERELHRDLALAIDLLSEAGCTDPEMIQNVVNRVLSLAARSRAPSLLPKSVRVLSCRLWRPDIYSSDHLPQLLELLGGLGTPAASFLIQTLSDASSHVRRAAVEALGELGTLAAVPHLIQALSDTNDDARAAAAEALGKLGDTAAVPHLIWTLSDTNDNARAAAAEALGKLGDTAAVPHLIQIEALSDVDSPMGWAAAEALGKLSDAAVPLLIQTLSDVDFRVRQAAAGALCELSDTGSVPHLIQALSNTDHNVREPVAVALGKLGHPAAVPLLIQTLSDADCNVRRAAVDGLGRLSDTAAVSPLILALSDADCGVREAVADALGKLGDLAAVPYLIEMLSDSASYVRWKAAGALGELGDAVAVSPLIQALSDADSSVRGNAAEALGRLGDATAVPALIRALSDADRIVRWRASFALDELGDAVAVPPLIKMLSSAESNVRWKVAVALGVLCDTTAVSHLFQSLSDTDSDVRWEAAAALSVLGDTTAVPHLIQALSDADFRVREAAAKALSVLGDTHRRAAPHPGALRRRLLLCARGSG